MLLDATIFGVLRITSSFVGSGVAFDWAVKSFELTEMRLVALEPFNEGESPTEVVASFGLRCD
ncbi:hypothetical protein D3C71_1088380 [compost metagenome]